MTNQEYQDTVFARLCQALGKDAATWLLPAAAPTPEPTPQPVFGAPLGYDAQALAAIMASAEATKIDPAVPIPEPAPLLLQPGMDGEPDNVVLRVGDIATLCGQAGSRKTTALTLLCADMIAPGQVPNSPFTAPRPLRVLYLDTEQHPADAQRITHRVARVAGTTAGMDVYALVSLDMAVIPYVAEQLIARHRPDVVVIDNAAQLGAGAVMEIDIAEALWRNLRRIAVAYDACIVGVIHVNESAGRGAAYNPRGHVGSEAKRQCDFVLSAQDQGATSKLESIKARRRKPRAWSVGIDECGMPYYVPGGAVTEGPKPGTVAANPDTYATILAQIPPAGMTHGELESTIMNVDGIAPRTARRRIANMLDAVVLIKADGRYYNTATMDLDATPSTPEIPL